MVMNITVQARRRSMQGAVAIYPGGGSLVVPMLEIAMDPLKLDVEPRS